VPINPQIGSKPVNSKNCTQVVHTSLFDSHNNGCVINIPADDLLGIARGRAMSLIRPILIALLTPRFNVSRTIVNKYWAKGQPCWTHLRRSKRFVT
jgi:hypothetical protein